MKKFFSSRFGKRLPVSLALFALCAAFAVAFRSYWGSDLVMERFVNLVAVFGTGIAGVLFLLAGWVGILFGYGFVLIITLPYVLPEPWDGYFVVFYLLALFALPTGIAYVRKKKKSAEKSAPDATVNPVQKTAAALSQTAGEAPVFVFRPSPGGVYQVFYCEDEFRFYRVGNSWAKMDAGRILLSGDLPAPGKRDIVLSARGITKVRYRDVDADLVPYDTLAVLSAAGRRYRFAPLFSPGGKAFRALLSAHAPQDALRSEQAEAEFVPAPQEKRQVWVKRAHFALCAAAVLVDLAWVFLDVPYRLFAWLSIAMTPAFLLLFLLFPNETTLGEIKKRANGRVMLPVALLMSAFIPLLRTMIDFNLLAWGELLLYAAACFVPLMLITLLLSPECRAKKVLLLTPALALSVWLIGALAMANVLLDSAPLRELPAAVQELEISDGSESPDRYLLTAQTADGRTFELSIAKSVYDTLAVGDGVIVLLGQGALHVPYADADVAP